MDPRYSGQDVVNFKKQQGVLLRDVQELEGIIFP